MSQDEQKKMKKRIPNLHNENLYIKNKFTNSTKIQNKYKKTRAKKRPKTCPKLILEIRRGDV